jgi:hypothetical protein
MGVLAKCDRVYARTDSQRGFLPRKRTSRIFATGRQELPSRGDASVRARVVGGHRRASATRRHPLAFNEHSNRRREDERA